MLKVIISVFVLFSYSLRAMEDADADNFARWKTVKLGILSEEVKDPAKNYRMNAQKQKFVATSQEKYAFQQRVLNELCLKTGGVIRATRDPEIAQEDPHKFLSSGSSDFTANELDERWDRIVKAMKENHERKQ